MELPDLLRDITLVKMPEISETKRFKYTRFCGNCKQNSLFKGFCVVCGYEI